MKPIKVAIFGLGNRGNFYGKLNKLKPEKMEIVQLVDCNKTALETARKLYGVDEKHCYLSVNEFLKDKKIADAVINCTMDQFHIETTMPLFKLGYDVLLEKPICNNEEELVALMNESKKYNKVLMVCHVLRYTPFYLKVKKLIDSKELGDLISLEMAEHVSLPHTMASFVRGKWRSEKECGSPMILAKCCHDTDLMCWFNDKYRPVKISSFGERTQFIPQRKPKDASDRCLTCKYVDTCQYSAYWYLNNKNFDLILFQNAVDGKNWDELTIEDKKNVFMGDNGLGKCIFDGPQDLVDHEQTIVNFENGVTGTLSMIGGCCRECRTIHVILTKGEIFGTFNDNKLTVRKYNMENILYKEKTYYFNSHYEGHGGGDIRLVEDFVDYLRNGKKSISQTNIEGSIDGHLVAIGADISRKVSKTILINEKRELIKQ